MKGLVSYMVTGVGAVEGTGHRAKGVAVGPLVSVCKIEYLNTENENENENGNGNVGGDGLTFIAVLSKVLE